MNRDGPRVSVILPAYKAANTICRAIDSVLSQSLPAHEIIVVDDGSPDDLAAVVSDRYIDQVVLIRQVNGRTAKARNTGIDRATGDWIAFLDADDYWESNKLAEQWSIIEKHPEVCLVAGHWYQEIPGEPRTCDPIRPKAVAHFDRVLQERGEAAFHLATLVSTVTVFMRRDALGGERFHSGLEPAEDRDLWIRVVSRFPSYLISKPLATIVLEKGSLSRSSIDRDCANMLTVVERHAGLLGKRGLRKWRSHTLSRWAFNDPNPSSALPRLLRSLALWPLPYTNIASVHRLGRTKRLLVLLGKLIGISKR